MKKVPGSGRKPGVPNRPKVPKVSDVFAERGIDPAGEVLALLNERKDDGTHLLSPAQRMDGWLELLSYCQSKPKGEDSPDLPEDDELQEVATADLLQIVKNVGG